VLDLAACRAAAISAGTASLPGKGQQ